MEPVEDSTLVIQNNQVPSRAELWSASAWAKFTEAERIALIISCVILFALPLVLGFLVNQACPNCAGDEGCPAQADGQPMPEVFTIVWILIYLRLGFIACRLAFITASHAKNFPHTEASKPSKWWHVCVPETVCESNRVWWARSGIFLGLLLTLFLAHIALGLYWVVEFNCNRDAEGARLILLLMLGSAIALTTMLAPVDIYSAAAMGFYVAWLVVAMILNQSSVSNSQETIEA